MDPDSFLNLLSPDLEDCEEWCPSSDSQYWDLTSRELPQLDSRDNFLQRNRSVPYSSVLKLSDIASALKGFSKTEANASPKMRTITPSTTVFRQSSSYGAAGSLKRDLLSDKSNAELMASAVPSPPLEVRSCSLKRLSSTKRMKLSLASFECHNSSPEHELRHRPLKRNGLSQREMHIFSERQRRKCMTDSFATLQSMIPKLKYQHTDRVTVLTEVITYIQSLRGTLEELERKKSDILEVLGLPDKYFGKKYLSSAMCLSPKPKRISSGLQDDAVSSVEVTARLSGRDVFVTLNIPKRKGVWSGVLMLLQRYSVEVVNATLTVCGENNFHCIHGKVANIDKLEGIDLQSKLEDLIIKELRRWCKR